MFLHFLSFLGTLGSELRITQLYMKKNTRRVVRFKRVLQIHILEGLPRKRYQVHQQRAPDPCGPTFQLITEHTPILDSRSQTNLTILNKSKHGYIHARIHKSARPAQHMSCSLGQVLHLWRAHRPPNPFLMRKPQVGSNSGSGTKEDYRHWDE